MNVRKFIAIALALAINCVVLAALNRAGPAALAGDAAVDQARIVTLPVTIVRPTPAQVELLRHEQARPLPARAASAAGMGGPAMQALVMPYYSYAPANATESA